MLLRYFEITALLMKSNSKEVNFKLLKYILPEKKSRFSQILLINGKFLYDPLTWNSHNYILIFLLRKIVFQNNPLKKNSLSK